VGGKRAAKHCCTQKRPLSHHRNVQACAASKTSKARHSGCAKQWMPSTANQICLWYSRKRKKLSCCMMLCCTQKLYIFAPAHAPAAVAHAVTASSSCPVSCRSSLSERALPASNRSRASNS
jgi:hypothetical protein